MPSGGHSERLKGTERNVVSFPMRCIFLCLALARPFVSLCLAAMHLGDYVLLIILIIRLLERSQENKTSINAKILLHVSMIKLIKSLLKTKGRTNYESWCFATTIKLILSKA